MEKDQLISMIHFLVKREDERAQENQELKDMVKDLRDTHKQDVKTQIISGEKHKIKILR